MFPNHINTNSSGLQSLYSAEQISKIYTHHTYPPAARLPRIVKIPLKNKFSFPTRLIRLEFDHSTVNYYSEIDTVILCGRISPPDSILTEDTKSMSPSSSTVSHRFVNNPFIKLNFR